jgi:hypothetical protein
MTMPVPAAPVAPAGGVPGQAPITPPPAAAPVAPAGGVPGQAPITPPPAAPPVAPAPPAYPIPYQPPSVTGQAPPTDSDSRDIATLPRWAQDQITGLRQESAARRIAARTATVNQHAFAAANTLGVNGHALLGSAAFQQAAAGLDPSAADFGVMLAAKVAELLSTNPWMAIQQPSTPSGPTPPASGGDFPGGTSPTAVITEEQLTTMTPQEIKKAYEDGRLKHLM